MGGSPRKLIDDGRLASVSRDESKIAFVRGTHLNEEMWVMEGNGEKPRRLVARERCMFGAPAWSSDGRRIASVIGTYALEQWQVNTSIALFNLDSGRQETTHLVYTVSEPPPNQSDANIWSVPLDSRGRVAGT